MPRHVNKSERWKPPRVSTKPTSVTIATSRTYTTFANCSIRPPKPFIEPTTPPKSYTECFGRTGVICTRTAQRA
jgi:hypothetical protein